jgi:hypothetical protein
MELVGVGTERTTAGTDALLALGAIVAILILRGRTPPSFGRAIWQAAFATLAAASLLGAATHGFAMPDHLRDVLWQPLYLALGATMSLFVAGAVRDWRGDRAARRTLPPLLLLALIFYGITRVTGGNFLAFVIYEAAALLLSLVIYLRLAASGARPGAAAMAAALALSLTAGAVQASDIGPVRLLWEFDHNGLFHLLQLFGLALLVAGLRRLLASGPPGSRA